MDEDLRPHRIDFVNSLLVILLIIAGGICFVLASYRTTFSGWLTPITAGIVLWLLAYHFKQLGRLY